MFDHAQKGRDIFLGFVGFTREFTLARYLAYHPDMISDVVAKSNDPATTSPPGHLLNISRKALSLLVVQRTVTVESPTINLLYHTSRLGTGKPRSCHRSFDIEVVPVWIAAQSPETFYNFGLVNVTEGENRSQRSAVVKTKRCQTATRHALSWHATSKIMATSRYNGNQTSTETMALTRLSFLQTLTAFLEETDIPPSAINAKAGDWSLEQVLQEKNLYDQNLNLDKDADTITSGWTLPCPIKAISPSTGAYANVLAVTVHPSSNQIVASLVTKVLYTCSDNRPYQLGERRHMPNNLLSLACAGNHLIVSMMDGTVGVMDPTELDGPIFAKIKAHSSFANQVVTTIDNDMLIIASAGWDKSVSICTVPLVVLEHEQHKLEPVILELESKRISCPANVQSVLFARHPDTNELYLVYTIRDSIYLWYLLLTPTKDPNGCSVCISSESGKQSLAPQKHSTWTSFSPSHIEVCPTDPTLIAVATSHTPSMKLIIARLLFPTNIKTETPAPTSSEAQQGTKDELAIRLVATTHAPQNDFSTPRCVWRPDGSGIWVSADDGIVRGIDASTGKVVQELKGGHDPGTKIRCLWAGMLGKEGEEREVLISGGFDKKMLVWEVEG